MQINTKINKKKNPKKRVFGYVDEAVVLETSGVTSAVRAVREKARDRSEGWASPGCPRPGSSPGCGPARLCSPETRRDNFHRSPHPPAPLWCWLDESKRGSGTCGRTNCSRVSGAHTYKACGGDCVALLSLWYPDPLARAPFICSWRIWGREWYGMLPIEARL